MAINPLTSLLSKVGLESLPKFFERQPQVTGAVNGSRSTTERENDGRTLDLSPPKPTTLLPGLESRPFVESLQEQRATAEAAARRASEALSTRKETVDAFVERVGESVSEQRELVFGARQRTETNAPLNQSNVNQFVNKLSEQEARGNLLTRDRPDETKREASGPFAQERPSFPPFEAPTGKALGSEPDAHPFEQEPVRLGQRKTRASFPPERAYPPERPLPAPPTASADALDAGDRQKLELEA